VLVTNLRSAFAEYGIQETPTGFVISGGSRFLTVIASEVNNTKYFQGFESGPTGIHQVLFSKDPQSAYVQLQRVLQNWRLADSIKATIRSKTSS
jgi:hypothetical protein